MAFIKVDRDSVLKGEEFEEVHIPPLTDTEYKTKVFESFKMCLNSKSKSKEVPVYYSYSSRITTTPKTFSNFPPSYMLASFLMTSFNLGMTESFKIIKVLNAFTKKGIDRSIVYRELHLDLSKIPVNVRDLFQNTKVVTDKYKTIEACVIVDGKLSQEMNKFIKIINNVAPQDYVKNKTLPRYKPLMAINSEDFLSMSTSSRLKTLSQTVNVKRHVLHVSLNVQRDIGNLGREYHFISNLPRTDRSKISNLYGYDFESALQTIVLAILQSIQSNVSLNITSNYVKNKAQVRQYVVNLLGVDTDKAKIIITAAYQGGSLGGISKIVGFNLSKDQREGMEALYVETKAIIEALLKVSSISFVAPQSALGSHFAAARWYAAKRTSEKHKLTKDFTLEYYNIYAKKYSKAEASKYAKSYMFYLWSYFEGAARKIVENHLKQPISLHDAVYTQDKSSFDSLNVSKIEDEIYTKIGINLKLGKA